MVKVVLKQGKPITYMTVDGEVKLTPKKEVEMPLNKAIVLIGDENLKVIFDKKDEQKIKKLKRTRFARLEREFGIEQNSDRKLLLEKMFPKPKPIIKKPDILKKTESKKVVVPVKAKEPKVKPKIDKAEATQE